MIVDTLAAYRLTRLLQTDTFPPALALRRSVLRRGGLWAELWECPWCLGMWVSLSVAVLRRGSVIDVVRRALAMSVAVGVMREIEDMMED